MWSTLEWRIVYKNNCTCIILLQREDTWQARSPAYGVFPSSFLSFPSPIWMNFWGLRYRNRESLSFPEEVFSRQIKGKCTSRLNFLLSWCIYIRVNSMRQIISEGRHNERRVCSHYFKILLSHPYSTVRNVFILIWFKTIWPTCKEVCVILQYLMHPVFSLLLLFSWTCSTSLHDISQF